MSTSTISIRLDNELNKELENLAISTGRHKSEIIRDAIKKQLAIDKFQYLRKKTLPFAESQAILTDEDIWKIIS